MHMPPATAIREKSMDTGTCTTCLYKNAQPGIDVNTLVASSFFYFCCLPQNYLMSCFDRRVMSEQIANAAPKPLKRGCIYDCIYRSNVWYR